MPTQKIFPGISLNDFIQLPHGVTLLGMSGVGKTLLSTLLRNSANWFHYSADYRIGTRYLAEHILDNIKFKIMRMHDPFVANLLRSDSIYINHNITVDNLQPVSTFLGMYGDTKLGGLDKKTFLERQKLYQLAEIESMKDVRRFIEKSWKIYNCTNFVNDASGSLCEICEPENKSDTVINALHGITLIVYIKADKAHEQEIITRAKTSPKPLFYNPSFIMPRLKEMPETGTGIDPLTFAKPLFPQLLKFRTPRYNAIAKNYGFTVQIKDLLNLDNGQNSTPISEQFLRLIYKSAISAAKNSDAAAKTFRNYIDTCIARSKSRT